MDISGINEQLKEAQANLQTQVGVVNQLAQQREQALQECFRIEGEIRRLTLQRDKESGTKPEEKSVRVKEKK